MVTESEYYGDSTQHGNYQYVSLDDMLTNFMLNYVGDDKTINNTSRHTVLFHLKRGLQELNYDALKEIKVMELEVNPNTLTLTIPPDYVNYVRISWVDDNGKLRPMQMNEKSTIAREYLQDHAYNILFDNDGSPLWGDSDNINIDTSSYYTSYEYDNPMDLGTNFKLRTGEANINGVFLIDKRAGVIQLSSNVASKNIVLEYISDGLEYGETSDIKINKLAEQSLYSYVTWAILDTKYGVQEYIIRRAQKRYIANRKTAKMRMNGLRYNELMQTLKGKNTWIK